MDYSLLKAVHVSCVVGSYGLFVVRGVWMLRESAQLAARWANIVPHVVDTVLLASAIAMVVISHQYPFMVSWITAKLLALIAYIGLGMVALKRGKTRRTRLAAWIAAQLVFLYIVAVALTHNPMPWRLL